MNSEDTVNAIIQELTTLTKATGIHWYQKTTHGAAGQEYAVNCLNAETKLLKQQHRVRMATIDDADNLIVDHDDAENPAISDLLAAVLQTIQSRINAQLRFLKELGHSPSLTTREPDSIRAVIQALITNTQAGAVKWLPGPAQPDSPLQSTQLGPHTVQYDSSHSSRSHSKNLTITKEPDTILTANAEQFWHDHTLEQLERAILNIKPTPSAPAEPLPEPRTIQNARTAYLKGLQAPNP